ncbi:MAG TPA: D-alanine--D-alanine ligase family protein [Acidimicrobiales bacterium]|jgi:D-alanine-D-alanine ligase|nr:D-alanine--D-alanine ligase family protein [Acidimicrobiales bacterium]
MAGDPRTRLIVIFGGQSAEHDVSRVTAAHVLRAADPSRYEVVPVGITRDGQWVFAEAAAAALQRGPAALPAALDAVGPSVEPSPALLGTGAERAVVAFPLLHGPLGEDGTVQGLLELLGIPYVGAGVLSSAAAMDKPTSKELLDYHGVPVARWRTVHAHESVASAAELAIDALGLPVFAKPANMGSSIGVSKARTVDELKTALDVALSYDDIAVVEEAVPGREIEVAVLGNDEPRASVPGEIIPSHEFYDYEDKYVTDGAKLLVPAPLDDREADDVRTLALAAFRVLRCSGMARVDFFYDADERGFVCNEINTIPGFTPISMYPKLWQASGLSYSELIDELVRLAQERHGRRRRRTDRT